MVVLLAVLCAVTDGVGFGRFGILAPQTTVPQNMFVTKLYLGSPQWWHA
jgi:hypothetical protein